MARCEALLAGGRAPEALSEVRGLTLEGNPAATGVLRLRARALYLSGTLDWKQIQAGAQPVALQTKVCCWQHVQGAGPQPAQNSCDKGLCFCSGNMGMAEKVYKEVLRQDPDSVASMKSIKRIRLMHTAKDAGNEAFKVSTLSSGSKSQGVRFGEAEQHGRIIAAHTAKEVFRLDSLE